VLDVGNETMRFSSVLMACALLTVVLVPPAHSQINAGPHDQDPGRLTVAVIGDSLGEGLWEGLYRALHGDKRLVVVLGAKRSVGFTTSDMTEQLDLAFAAGKVDALAIMIGANDDRRSFFVDGKAAALFGTEKWTDLYRGRINNFMDQVGRKNVPLVWVLLPVMRTPEGTEAARLTNGIIEHAAQGRAYVTLISIWTLTADDAGAYMPYFNDFTGHKRLMRHSDGLHFTEPGYELLSHMVFDRLLAVSPRFKSMTSVPTETLVR
jgi:uncharacterized protein